MLQHVDDRAAVRLILDQHRPRHRVQRPRRPDRLQRLRERHALVQAVAEVVVVHTPLAPDRDRHIVARVRLLKRSVDRDDLRAEPVDLLRVVVPPPLAVDDVAALHPGRAHVQGRPRSRAALRVVDIGGLEVRQPRRVLTKLRAQGLPRLAAKRVVLLSFHRQPDETGVLFRLENAGSQIILVPRRHDHDDLRAGSQSGLDTVLPLLPDLPAPCVAVCLFTGFDGVVDDDELGRVACDA